MTENWPIYHPEIPDFLRRLAADAAHGAAASRWA